MDAVFVLHLAFAPIPTMLRVMDSRSRHTGTYPGPVFIHIIRHRIISHRCADFLCRPFYTVLCCDEFIVFAVSWYFVFISSILIIWTHRRAH